MTVEEWKQKNPPIQRKPMTNADRIRGMSYEELAHTLWLTAKGGIIGQRSEDEWINWLRREATSDERIHILGAGTV